MLCDLRMHGQSQTAAPPHTLRACAQDMLSLMRAEDRAGRTIAALLGHSFGGRVALEMRHLSPSTPETWLIDSSPSSRAGAMEDESNTVVQILQLLEAMASDFESRDAFVARDSALSDTDAARIEKLGVSSPVCMHEVQGSYWLHVDGLDPLVALVAARLP